MFTETELEYLLSQRLGRLATSQPDGTLQVNPVGFGVNQELGTIDIGGFNMSRSRKYRNVADNGRAAFVVDDVVTVDPWRIRFIEIRGHAEATLEPEDGEQNGGGSGPIIRLRPERVISAGLQPGDLDRNPHEMAVQRRNIG